MSITDGTDGVAAAVPLCQVRYVPVTDDMTVCPKPKETPCGPRAQLRTRPRAPEEDATTARPISEASRGTDRRRRGDPLAHRARRDNSGYRDPRQTDHLARSRTKRRVQRPA